VDEILAMGRREVRGYDHAHYELLHPEKEKGVKVMRKKKGKR